MRVSRRGLSAGVLFAQAATLTVCAVGFERGFAAFERRVPREIFFEPSFTLGFLQLVPVVIVIFALGLCSLWPDRSSRLAWKTTDTVGGLRWVVFGVAAMLAWTHSGHAINDYYGQAHIFDRWLLVGLAVATLRSPLVIGVFALQLVLARVQLHHPINAQAPIGDELPLRLLGAVFTAALLNFFVATRGFERLKNQLRAGDLAIATSCLVFVILCFIGSYYGYAGVAKLTIGRTPIDWIQEAHLENLFVGAYLNGWSLVGRADTMLDLANAVTLLSVPFALVTTLVECSMVLLLVHRRMTLVLVTAIIAMHVGIVMLSGIFFWKWLGIDLMLAVWLFRVRHNPQIRAIYSPVNAVVSVALIVLTMATFGLNDFTWWNTRWVSIIDVEVRDESGHTYRIDPRDFDPYMLKDFMQPPGTVADTVGFGTTSSQAMMERLQDTNPATLRAFLAHRRAENSTDTQARQRLNATDFFVRVFRNRNARVKEHGPDSHRVFPFLASAPPIHLRRVRGENYYRDQSRAAEVLIRHIEIFYTGDELVRVGDEVLHTVPIPAT